MKINALSHLYSFKGNKIVKFDKNYIPRDYIGTRICISPEQCKKGYENGGITVDIWHKDAIKFQLYQSNLYNVLHEHVNDDV